MSPVMVSMGRRYGRHDHSRSNVETWARCNCLVRAAQNRSRGLLRFHALKSAPAPLPPRRCGISARQDRPGLAGAYRHHEPFNQAPGLRLLPQASVEYTVNVNGAAGSGLVNYSRSWHGTPVGMDLINLAGHGRPRADRVFSLAR